jgi:hypothetical protein
MKTKKAVSPRETQIIVLDLEREELGATSAEIGIIRLSDG